MGTIQITMNRQEVTGHDYGDTVQMRTPEDALELMLRYELGYGGRVLDITERSVVTQTRVLSKIDTTTFTGSPEDMALLLAGVHAWLEAERGVNMDNVISQVLEIPGANRPLICRNLLGIFRGDAVTRRMSEDLRV